ncbi:MAG: FAD:protein FMN transferase [Clostridia bacterium]|nr:FAD:protein FMN transferase [Clostridia bacterium]
MIKRISSFIILSIMVLSLLSSCGEEEVIPSEYYSATFFAMDTEVTVKLARDTGLKDEKEKTIYHDDAHLSEIVRSCADIAKEKELLLSATDESSAISELNRESDVFLDFNEEVTDLLKKSFEISAATDGAFDVTIGTVTKLWNVTGGNPEIPSDDDIASALSHVGYGKIELDGANVKKLDRETKLDLGAIGKGYALGLMTEYLATTDVVYGLVSFGGNVGVFGAKPNGAKFKVGITDALDTSRVCGYVFVDKQFVSVSGDYERFFTADGCKYSHIFDPATGRPAETDITGVAVICPDSSYADALSTALFVKGSDGAIEFYNTHPGDFEAVIQTKDGRLILTGGLMKDGEFEEYVEPPATGEE